jgi:hypothetical protein
MGGPLLSLVRAVLKPELVRVPRAVGQIIDRSLTAQHGLERGPLTRSHAALQMSPTRVTSHVSDARNLRECCVSTEELHVRRKPQAEEAEVETEAEAEVGAASTTASRQ